MHSYFNYLIKGRTVQIGPHLFSITARLSFMLALLFLAQGLSATTYYVRTTGNDSNAGTSWAAAFKTLAKAIDAANAGDEIWVAAGTYYPDEGPGLTNGLRTLTFSPKDGVGIYGGFAGSETSLSQRDFTANVTILSGDLNQNDTPNFGNRGDNAYTVVRAAGSSIGNSAILDGFTITGGNSGNGSGYGGYNNAGGGIYTYLADPTLRNLIVTDNSAGGGGGAQFDEGSAPIVYNCQFIGNRSYVHGAVTIEESGSSPTLINCIIAGNQNTGSSGLTIQGALYIGSAGSPSFTNCTITGNEAPNAVHNYATPGVTFTNCIIYENSSNSIFRYAGGTYSFTNCLLPGNCPSGSSCTNLLNADPRFSTPADPTSAPTTAFDLTYMDCSPVIDAGTNSGAPSDDVAGDPRPSNGTADLGAYEYQGAPGYCCPSGNVVYVKANASGANTGENWTDAFTDLQTALDMVRGGSCPSVDEIWVAAGTYYPDEGAGQTDDDESSTFELIDGVGIYGGFTGSETSLSQRDYETNVTTLNGDLLQNDGTAFFTNNTDNANSIVTALSGVSNSAILDGFTITGGNGSKGGGLYCYPGSPTVNNCIIEGNGAGEGGGAYVRSSTVFNDCEFLENKASSNGGAIYGYGNAPVYNRCRFAGNSGSSGGGAVMAIFSDPTFNNCLLTGNLSKNGAGLFVYGGSSQATLTNCTFSGNRAVSNGSAMYLNNSATITATNCIFWRNKGGSQSIYENSGTNADVTYSITQDFDGVGNLFEDPLHYEAPGSGAAPTTAGDFHLIDCSPAIDVGTNTGAPSEDFDGNPRPVNSTGSAITDMGAFENQHTNIDFTTRTWNGSVSQDWDDPLNWTPNCTASASDSLVIPDVGNDPIIYSGTAGVGLTLSVESGAVLTINSGGSLTLSGAGDIGLELDGEINNNGTLSIENTGSFGVRVVGSGVFNNSGLFNVDGTGHYGVNINDSAVVTNTGDFNIGQLASSVANAGMRIEDTGQFINDGGAVRIDNVIDVLGSFGDGVRMANSGFLENKNDGNIIIGQNGGVEGNGIILFNTSMLTNSQGSIEIDSTGVDGIQNKGTFVNENGATLLIGQKGSIGRTGIIHYTGTVGFVNDASVIKIDNTTSHALVNQDFKNGVFYNNNGGQILIGQITPYSSIALYNRFESYFENNGCSEIHINGKFSNTNAESSFINNGLLTIDYNGSHANGGTFTNNGIINYLDNGETPNIANNGIIVSPVSTKCPTVADALDLGTGNAFTVLDEWFLEETLTNKAGDYSQTDNELTITNLTEGSTTDVFFTATDGTCTFDLSLEVDYGKTTAVSALCQNHAVTLDAQGSATISTADIDNGSSDICGLAGLALSQEVFTCADVGNNTVTLTATSTDGTSAQCTATVTVSAFTGTGQRTWTGAVSTDWADPDNWQNACLPTAADEVTIPDVANDPVILAATSAFAKKITVDGNALLTINTNASLTVGGGSDDGFTVNGSVVNAGTVNIDDVTSQGLIINENSTFDNQGGTLNLGQSVGSIGSNAIGVYGSGAVFTNDGGTVRADKTGEGDGSNGNALKMPSAGQFVNKNGGICYFGQNGGNGAVGIKLNSNSTFINDNAVVNVDYTGTKNSTYADGVQLNNSSFENKNGAQLLLGQTGGIARIGIALFSNATFTNNNGIIKVDNIGTINTSFRHGIYVGSSNFENIGGGQITVAQIGGVANLNIFNSGNGQFINDASTIEVYAGGNRGLYNQTGSTFINRNGGMLHLGVTGAFNVHALTLNDNVSFTNETCAEVHLKGKLYSNSNFTNTGLLTSDLATSHTNSGTFNNSGVINYLSGAEIPNVTNNALIVSDAITECSPATNILQIGADNPFTVLEEWFLDESLTNKAGDYDQANNDFTITNISEGSTEDVFFTADNGSCSFDLSLALTYDDTTPPTALCKAHTVQLNASGNGSLAAADIDDASSDNCDVASLSASPNEFDCSDVGSNSVTLTVTDIHGLTSTCTATVTVEDTVQPTANCKAHTVQLNASGNGSLTANDINGGSADACGVASLSASPNEFDCSDVGNNTVTLTVTDNNGNEATCTASVTVEDSVAPTATCKAHTVQLNASGNGSLTANDIDGGSADACGVASLLASPNEFDCANIGSNTVTLTVTDNNGNTNSCTAIVTVEDNINPNPVCNNPTVQLGSLGTYSLVQTDVLGNSSDNCGLVHFLSMSVSSVNCGHVGTPVVVTVNTFDANGNQASCVATVTVEDSVQPTATCRSHTVQLNASGNGSLTANDINNGSTDACGIASLAASPNTFGCADVGSKNVTLTVTDVNGNAATCTANVTVEDNLAPTAICKTHTVHLDANGNGSLAAADINNGSSDNCSIASLSASPSSFACADVGTQSATLTVTDVNGNLKTCTAYVTVVDNVAPSANCTTTTINATLDANAQYTVDPNDLDDGSTDACGIQSLSASPSQLDCQHEGTNTVTLTVTDVNGNTASCNATMEVAEFLTVSSITATPESCAGAGDGQVIIDATAGGGQVKYSIDGGVNFQSGNSFFDLSPGNYNVVVKVFGVPAVCKKMDVANVADGSAPTIWQKDLDGDGYTDGTTMTGCTPLPGYVANANPGDCDDNDPLEHPGQIWYEDLDGDDHGSGNWLTACTRPAGCYVATELISIDGDCNDSNPAICPGVPEICDGLDNDCDGEVDEGLSGLTYTGNVMFTSQAQLNGWLPCYSVIDGSVTIQGGNITDLGPLSNITEITGNLSILFNTVLTSLEGMNNLATVGGSLLMYYNFQLDDCCAIYDLLDNGGVSGITTIFFNKAGSTCNSVADILNACAPGNSLIAPTNGLTSCPDCSTYSNSSGVSLFPNPTAGDVRVRLPIESEGGIIRIADVQGRELRQQRLAPGQTVYQFSLCDLKAGVYFVSVKLVGRKMEVRKLVLAK